MVMSYNRKSEANKSSNNNVDSHVTGVSLVVAFNMDQLYPLFVLYVADVVSMVDMVVNIHSRVTLTEAEWR